MAPPYHFGVEIEFCVAFVFPKDAELPDKTETRKLRFNLDTADSESSSEDSSEKGPTEHFSTSSTGSNVKKERAMYKKMNVSAQFTPAMQKDIADTLVQAGFPAFSSFEGPEGFVSFAERDFQRWSVDTDGSIEPPLLSPYVWAPIELISPAMEFNLENLETVRKVYNLITSTYVTHNGPTTGLHVHVSAGIGTAFRLETLQSLFAFLYAFEPQISTLHPARRQRNVTFCDSIRRRTDFVSEWWEDHGVLPTVFQGVTELLKKEPTLNLLAAVRVEQNDKATRYNPSNLAWFLEQPPGNRNPPTIEFRQHEGTLDAGRVVNWIRTVVGIVNFVDTAELDSLSYLLRKAGDEKWQKEGGDGDAEQLQKFGPIPAEGNFTIIDLFRFMQLDDLATFYSNAIHEVLGVPPISRTQRWLWEYEQQWAQRRITDEEFQRQHEMRLLWEQSLNSALAQQDGSTFDFNPDDEMWPVRIPIERSATNHSGFTLHANHQFDFTPQQLIELSSGSSSNEPDNPSEGSSHEPTQSEVEEIELEEIIGLLEKEDDEEDLYSAD
ncbi:hypothetical protein L207DRAFT_637921 [Hyaloscypha variabilis F]|uniref:Amidoligase enzyme n=1 Tax=Hyaloscypha variabilis (strain UAMH 11265 / GT02V1 / F) TaxID=1149755 RepID=A0A2J6RAQ6_HYAVF|nr:hypothetical protein L207DRAFT_637921 [Hyaloscypha variabilis F]